MSKKKIGRPRKRPDYDHDKSVQEVVDKAVSLFGKPYDDREYRDPSEPSVNFVAKEMHSTLVRARKLLITAGYFSTETSRTIKRMSDEGMKIADIADKIGLSIPVVYSYLPYQRGAYNLEEKTLNAERMQRIKVRSRACEDLASHLDQSDEITAFWSAIDAFQGYPYTTAKGEHYRYSINAEGLLIYPFDHIIPKVVVEEAYIKYRNDHHDAAVTRDDEDMSDSATRFLYPIFRRFGVSGK